MSEPKVSYALLCYRQEDFVRDAVRSALAQDLTPLDIILSDDCSDDGTYAVLEEEARAYRGPNPVRLNRNESNLGIEHYNKIVEIAKGDLVIVAHGDDVALPHRASRLAEAWAGGRGSVLSSNAWIADAQGRPLGLLCRRRDSHAIPLEDIIEKGWDRTMLGAALAFDREVFTSFGPLDSRAIPVGTDHILPFRGALLRGMYYVGEPLLRWRQHTRNVGDLVGDKTGSDLSFQETYTAYRMMTMMAMYGDIIRFGRTAPEGRGLELEHVRRRLQARIGQGVQRWIWLRNQLYLEGKRPAWIDKAELAARGIRGDLRVLPEVPMAEIGDADAAVPQP